MTGAALTSWFSLAPMLYARIQHRATWLPTGKVLVTGGKNASGAVRVAELFDPDNGTWSQMATAPSDHIQHATDLFLTYGRTVSMSGDGNVNAGESFGPPYLYKEDGTARVNPGDRPIIDAFPASISYKTVANPFFEIVVTRNEVASTGTRRVTLLRPGSMTHSTNFEQRLAELKVETTTDNGNGTLTLTVERPWNSNVAPPGFYMLFVVNRDRVPSTAKWVQLG